MTDLIRVSNADAAYDEIYCDAGIAKELEEHFTFYAPNYQFHPKYRNKVWDGKIRLITERNRYLYVGLRQKLAQFCVSRQYYLHFDEEPVDTEFSIVEAKNFADTLGLPKEMNGIPFEVRDYQLQGLAHSVRKGRCVLLSPTASGKSLLIYMIARYYNKKTLLIVPTLGLVDQMYNDFAEYGYDVEANVHRIYAGQEKHVDHPIVVSTWQSMASMGKEYLAQFDVVICDEVHHAKAKEIRSIMERCSNAHFRIGLTGTLDGSETNELVITGLFGPPHRLTTTAELIAQGKLADFKIKAIVLVHPESARKMMARKDYQTELDYLVTNVDRNEFIKNLALSLKGNTLVLFRFVEKHGEVLKKMIEAEAKVPVLYVAGKVPREDREVIRKFVNEQTDSITIASVGTFSTGTNIPNLNNLIFTHPSKSLVQVLQAIGRALRLTARKSVATLYDIADDLTWKSWTNHTMNHYVERIKIYAKERFRYKPYRVNIGG